jgi:hypothetical protein
MKMFEQIKSATVLITMPNRMLFLPVPVSEPEALAPEEEEQENTKDENAKRSGFGFVLSFFRVSVFLFA